MRTAEPSRVSMAGHLYDGATSHEWYTPPHIFEALELTFDLDPCAPPGGVPWIPAARHYSFRDNGLQQPWNGRVWLNPPYGRETAVWVHRLVTLRDGIALVFARTDTNWAQSAMHTADAVCLIAGRLSFIDGHGSERRGHSAAAPSMLLAYGEECAQAVSFLPTRGAA
jgi:hypothetical protein